MEKTLSPGWFANVIQHGKTKINYKLEPVNIEIKIKNKDGKLCLSICGDSDYCMGQIHDSIVRQIEIGSFRFNELWNKELLFKLIQVWERWHLNDLHAGCIHQRELGWGSNNLIIYEYRLNEKYYALRREIFSKTKANLKRYGQAVLTDDEWFIINLLTDFDYAFLHPYFEKYYKVNDSKQQLSGNTYQKEHPDGELCKPCPICGYKYGTAWLYEPLPEDVISFLKELPENEHNNELGEAYLKNLK